MKTIRSCLLLLTLGLLSPVIVTHSAQTQTQVQSTHKTASLISYLTPLIEEQLLGDTELLKFINALDQGEIVNLIPHLITARYGVQFTKSAFQYHYDHVQLYLELEKESPGTLDRAQLLLWARASLREKQRVREERAEAREVTQYIYQKMIFHTLEPGTFNLFVDDYMYFYNPKTVQVKLTEPFDLMSTQVTQWQWSMIEGSNPSHFKDGDESIEIEIQGHAVMMQPDYPVENVSWDDVQNFIEKLNQLSKEGDFLLKTLIPDHQSGDQYRLPTDAEWNYVVQASVPIQDDYFFGKDLDQFSEYAWFDKNSKRRTHPVAQLKPLIVAGKAFYDLLGNVNEWVQDSSLKIENYFKAKSIFEYLKFKKIKLINPQFANRVGTRVLRGGGFNSCPCPLARRYHVSGRDRSSNFGLRLLRTRRNPRPLARPWFLNGFKWGRESTGRAEKPHWIKKLSNRVRKPYP